MATAAVKDTRAYLLRVATNLWIDQLRRKEVRPNPKEIHGLPLSHARAGSRNARSGCEAAFSGFAAAACGHRAKRHFRFYRRIDCRDVVERGRRGQVSASSWTHKLAGTPPQESPASLRVPLTQLI